jgi:hypothetical protein
MIQCILGAPRKSDLFCPITSTDFSNSANFSRIDKQNATAPRGTSFAAYERVRGGQERISRPKRQTERKRSSAGGLAACPIESLRRACL